MEVPNSENLGCPDISDYAVVGNCHGVALITKEGRVDWCALQAFDADPVCFHLLDDRIGGYLDTRPMTPFQATRRYVPHTNVLETTFTTASGVAMLTDFMPVGRRPDAADDDFIRIHALPCLVRIIHVTEGEVRLNLDMLICLRPITRRSPPRRCQAPKLPDRCCATPSAEPSAPRAERCRQK